jgi:CDP-diacylglycerol--glycerol-3-phosphate 3-phosphatidyltransferase
LIDMRVRPRLQWLLQPIGRNLARTGLTPTMLTFSGLGVTVAGAAVIGLGRPALGAGVAAFGSALDGLDGSVARATGTESPRGAFVDAVADRLGEVAVFTGLAVAQAGSRRVVLLIVLALSGSLVVPYLRAKAESVGLNGSSGFMGRAERVILFSAGLLSGLVEPMLWVMVVATWITVAQRFFDTYRAFDT